MTDLIKQAAERIAEAESLLITAGAGMGVDSGLPDFRGNDGFWRLYPKYAEQKLSFADLANPSWFHTHPERAWGFYGYRYNLYRDTQPHEGFRILKSWLAQKLVSGFVYTSNVDGHFQKAGFNPAQVYECHGSIQHLQCVHSDCNGKVWPTKHLNIQVNPDTLLAISSLPRCPDCGGIARPNILMFNDWDWLDNRAREQYRYYQQWSESTKKQNIAIIEIGAGVSVGRIRSIGDIDPHSLIRINPRHPDGRNGTISLAMDALEALTAINEQLTV